MYWVEIEPAFTPVIVKKAREMELPELARRADVPVMIMPLPTAAAVIEAVRSGVADIGFVAPNPQRTGLVLYSQTYMLVQQKCARSCGLPAAFGQRT